MRDVVDLSRSENKNIHSALEKFLSENPAIYEINAGKKNTQCIVSIPVQQWLRESATRLRYTYVVFLILTYCQVTSVL